jgi:hypothetical protein
MGKHSAPEPEQKPKGHRVRAIIGYCQPFYKRYRKFIVAALGAAIVALQAAISDGTVTPAEWYMIATSAAAAAGVWTFPNATNKKVIKNDVKVQ